MLAVAQTISSERRLSRFVYVAHKPGASRLSFLARVIREDLTFLTELLEQGEIMTVIDKRYSLSETREAMRDFGVEHAPGKVIITVDHCSNNS